MRGDYIGQRGASPVPVRPMETSREGDFPVTYRVRIIRFIRGSHRRMISVKTADARSLSE